MDNPDYIPMLMDVGLLDYNEEWPDDVDILNDLRTLNKYLKKHHPEEFKKLMKTQKFKNKVSPYYDLDWECGFIRVLNTEKRYDDLGNECRESILAGSYVTMWSRWVLLGTLKGEMDNGNIILYSDTDSIKLLQLNPPKFVCDDKELGA